MDLKKLSTYVIIIGVIIFAIGGIKYASNLPEKYDQSKSEQTIFGRNDLGNMARVNLDNWELSNKRESATTIMIIGGVIAIIGGILSASSKSQKQQSNPISSNNFIFCSTCGKKYSSSSTGHFCDECGNKL